MAQIKASDLPDDTSELFSQPALNAPIILRALAKFVFRRACRTSFDKSQPGCAGPREPQSLRGAKRPKQSIVPRAECGLLRGACHRARVRATRWLAMTATGVTAQATVYSARS